MRITSVQVRNVAGLRDGRLELAELGTVALAGPNGSGKSRLLMCLLAPWMRDIPAAANPEEEASVDVSLSLDTDERAELRAYSIERGWGDVEQPANPTFTLRRGPRAGVQWQIDPPSTALDQALQDNQFLARMPALDLVYFPAERRLASSGGGPIDLAQLDPAILRQQIRSARTLAGRLDDTEFEAFARALCVAEYLPEGEPGRDPAPNRHVELAWPNLKAAVDQLLAPKELMPLTRQRPDALQIRIPNGHSHTISELSSGERQALVILGRVFRAAGARSVVAIDEPDLHLHPRLSAQLLTAISSLGVRQLIVATHSPSVLDRVPPSAIWHMRADQEPRRLLSEADRVALYREAGFRAAELTQADLLVVTEGLFDGDLLKDLDPELHQAAFRSAGGRERVIHTVSQLAPFGVPILGIVDRDVDAAEPPANVHDLVHVWPVTDIEAAFLADEQVLQAMIDQGFLRPEFANVATVQARLDRIVQSYRDNAIAELAIRLLRARRPDPFPSPRGENPIRRLQEAWLGPNASVRPDDFNATLDECRARYDAAQNKWEYVRGKWVLGEFASQASTFRTGGDLLHATARVLRQPPAMIGEWIRNAKQRLERR